MRRSPEVRVLCTVQTCRGLSLRYREQRRQSCPLPCVDAGEGRCLYRRFIPATRPSRAVFGLLEPARRWPPHRRPGQTERRLPCRLTLERVACSEGKAHVKRTSRVVHMTSNGGSAWAAADTPALLPRLARYDAD